jgi:sigma-B regulation protein RsbU (phosphoserine phosphatase)
MATPPTRSLPPAPQPAPLQRLGRWFLHTWTGRVVGVSLVVWILDAAGVRLPGFLTGPAWLVGVTFCWVAAYRLFRWLLRRWLWRIRTKLILSYMFVAVVPLVLLALFFGLAGVMFSGVVSSYMVTSEIGRRADEIGRATGALFPRLLATGAANADAVEEGLAPLKERFPALTYTFVRDGRRLAASGTMAERLPDWLQQDSFAGLVRDGDPTRVRAVARRGPSFLAVDVPLDEHFVKDLDPRAGIRILAAGGGVRMQRHGVNIDIDSSPSPGPSASPRVGVRPEKPVKELKVDGLPFFATPEQTNWSDGTKDSAGVAFQYQPLELVRVLTPGKVDTAGFLFTALAVVGVIFLVMYAMALLLGVMLARSVTRSVHSLSRGTERLRQGRFDQPIPVRTRDQLGELAESFNLMASDIQQLMRESAEKERLEEELRIARRIQMSLLPQGTVTVPHVSIAAACIPATEVGGDYYDLLILPGDRLAVLVADVSGKGTSAALYMAELKGLMLSLSRVHESPAEALAEANRILTADMDARSFITMSYALLDPRAGRMRYARAGHSPLVHRDAKAGTARLLAPPGLGLGLDAGTHFERVLEETDIPLASGDVFLFFTDGLSEAMNAGGELFGEERLRELLERNGRSADELRDHVLEEVRRFVGEAPQHDDMTMVVIKID